MPRRALLLVAIAALVAAGALLWRAGRSGVRRQTTAQGEIVSVEGRYTIVMLSPQTMVQAFGPQWDRLTLFYGTNRGVTEQGQRAHLASSPLRPLAKGTPLLLVSGTAWPDLIVPLYALETRQQATLAIDTVHGSIALTGPAAARAGVPQVTAEGRLIFR